MTFARAGTELVVGETKPAWLIHVSQEKAFSIIFPSDLKSRVCQAHR